MRDALLILGCVGLMVAAQTLWRLALMQSGAFDSTSSSLFSQLLQLLSSWRILFGAGLFVAATVIWWDLLSRRELSLLYPFMSLAYVFSFFVGWIWLAERPQPLRLWGILVICVGIFLVSRTGTEQP